jgi:DNA-binding GntR family transcriptional regulator
MTADVPAAVRDLLERRIDSFEKLELVMRLRGAPHAMLSVQELADSLRIPRDIVRQLVVELRATSLVDLTSRGHVHLLPPSAADEAAVEELANLYKHDPARVFSLVSEIAMDRIRRMAVETFGDALGANDDDK